MSINLSSFTCKIYCKLNRSINKICSITHDERNVRVVVCFAPCLFILQEFTYVILYTLILTEIVLNCMCLGVCLGPICYSFELFYKLITVIESKHYDNSYE